MKVQKGTLKSVFKKSAQNWGKWQKNLNNHDSFHEKRSLFKRAYRLPSYIFVSEM